MKHSVLLLSLALSVIGAGCPGQTDQPRGPGMAELFGSEDKGPAAEDGFTILLATFRDADHAQRVRAAKEDLQKNQRWTDVYAVTHADHSELYRGRYRTAEQAKAPRQKAESLVYGGSFRPFSKALVVPMPGKSVGPPQWNLAACSGEYSLLVAVFENSETDAGYYAGCKEDAVAYCQKLREQGEEAYYHHGPGKSSVTIGCFPGKSILTTYKNVFQGDNPDPVRQSVVEIVDPALLALQQRYPQLLWNGRTFYLATRDSRGNVVQKDRKEAETYPVRVPDKEEPPIPRQNLGQ